MIKLTEPQQRVLDALKDGASVSPPQWQQMNVYWPMTPRRFTARVNTFYALRDRGLITMDKNGINVTDAGRAA